VQLFERMEFGRLVRVVGVRSRRGQLARVMKREREKASESERSLDEMERSVG